MLLRTGDRCCANSTLVMARRRTTIEGRAAETIAKLTSKNRITLPKAVVNKFPGAEYFAVREVGGEIILKPVRMHSLDAVWRKIESLGITEKDVADAVRWARRPKNRVKSSAK
jgi:hypothetical protein